MILTLVRAKQETWTPILKQAYNQGRGKSGLRKQESLPAADPMPTIYAVGRGGRTASNLRPRVNVSWQ